MKKKKFFAGCLLISLSILTGGILVSVFGDINLTSSLRNFSLNHPDFIKVINFITKYGNYLYYFLFTGFFLYGVFKKEKKLVKIGVIYFVLQIVISVLFTTFIKNAIGRPRPGYGYTHHFFTGRYIYESFPSGHAVDASCSAGVLWSFLSSYSLSFSSFLFSLLIGLSRIFIGAHYFLDVLAGMVLGFFPSILVMSKLRAKGDSHSPFN